MTFYGTIRGTDSESAKCFCLVAELYMILASVIYHLLYCIVYCTFCSQEFQSAASYGLSVSVSSYLLIDFYQGK